MSNMDAAPYPAAPPLALIMNLGVWLAAFRTP
jgi:hypothetical protein